MVEVLYQAKYCPIIFLFITLITSNSYVFGQKSVEQNGSNAHMLHLLGYTGLGVNVGLISARNVRSTHLAFNDVNGCHIFNLDYSGDGVNYTGGAVPGHDTWVAGIIASRGWPGHETDIGAAPGCNVYSARIVSDLGNVGEQNLENAFSDLINNYNCRVFVIPLQFGDTADGSSDFTKIADYFAWNDNVILALAAGNINGGNMKITVFGDAYNGITTGTLVDEPNGFYSKVGYLSLAGYTVDGRKKPDITSPGSSQLTPHIASDVSYYTTVKDGATSFSIPQTGGVAALLLQYADSTAEPYDNQNIVIKAVIVNSAFPNIRDKSGAYTDPANRVWDPNRGYGRIDALKAYQTLSAGRFSKEANITSAKGWAYDTMNSNQTHTYMISGIKKQRLVLTVTWNRAVNKNKFGYSIDTPLFKLDVTVKDPLGQTIFYQEADNNNLHKLDLVLPTDGNYSVILHNITSKSRSYALAFELSEPLQCDFNNDFVVDEKDLAQLSIDWLNSGTGLLADITEDGVINNKDLGEFAENWRSIDGRYYVP